MKLFESILGAFVSYIVVRGLTGGSQPTDETRRGAAAPFDTPILFANDSAVVAPRYAAQLRAVSSYVRSGGKVRCIGYASTRGGSAANDELSWRRARAVAAELERLGAPGSRIEAIGSGETARWSEAEARRVDIERV